MNKFAAILLLAMSFTCTITSITSPQSAQTDYELMEIFQNCHKSLNTFDSCMMHAFNEVRKFFKDGLPQYGVAPFDPHRSPYVEVRRGDGNGAGGFKLILKNVSEHGWQTSNVTKYRTDWPNKRIVYSQYFPEKSLDGLFDFSGKLFGNQVLNRGKWNMVLYDYSQTTSITRVGGEGGLVKVRVEIDRIGDLKLHITNLFGGISPIEGIADFLINAMWQTGFPFMKPIINELVSTAFTDIFTESFRYFPIDKFIKE